MSERLQIVLIAAASPFRLGSVLVAGAKLRTIPSQETSGSWFRWVHAPHPRQQRGWFPCFTPTHSCDDRHWVSSYGMGIGQSPLVWCKSQQRVPLKLSSEVASPQATPVAGRGDSSCYSLRPRRCQIASVVVLGTNFLGRWVSGLLAQVIRLELLKSYLYDAELGDPRHVSNHNRVPHTSPAGGILDYSAGQYRHHLRRR